jgi:hypothetical protein
MDSTLKDCGEMPVSKLGLVKAPGLAFGYTEQSLSGPTSRSIQAALEIIQKCCSFDE